MVLKKLGVLTLVLLGATACTDAPTEVVTCTPSCDASACQFCDVTGAAPACVALCAQGAVCDNGVCVPPAPAPTCAASCGACMHCDTSGAAPACVSNCGPDTLCQDNECVPPPAITCDPGCGPCEMCDTSSGTGVCVKSCGSGSVCEAASNACVSAAAYHAELGAAGGPLHGPFANAYAVTAACLTCHAAAGAQLMASAHWNWMGTTPDLVAADGLTAVNPGNLGKKNIINNFCIGVPSNEKRCDQCHAGYGGDPVAAKPQKSARAYTSADATTGDSSIPLASRIDCLICHSNPTTGYAKDPKNFGLPTAAVNLVVAARDIIKPTRTNCGACHFYAGGADSVKLMGSALKNPSEAIDVHMGRGLGCNECHVSEGHAFKGGGTHTPTHTARASCEDCHTATPHEGKVTNGATFDSHTAKLACQTCHIPKFSRGQFTKVSWDWSTAGDNVTCAGVAGNCTAGVVTAKVQDDGVTPDTSATATAVTNYDYVKGTFRWQRNVVPAYRWSSGKATHMLISDKADFSAAGLTTADADRISLGEPVGTRTNGKIMPFKLMRGRQAFYINGGQSFAINPSLFGPTAFWGVIQAAGWRHDSYDFDGAAPGITGLESFDANGNGAIDPGAESIAALQGKIFATGAVAGGQLTGLTVFPRWSASTPATPGYDWRYTKLYMDINHEVAPKAAALGAAGCQDCHGAASSIKLPLCELYAGGTLPWGVTGCP